MTERTGPRNQQRTRTLGKEDKVTTAEVVHAETNVPKTTFREQWEHQRYEISLAQFTMMLNTKPGGSHTQSHDLVVATSFQKQPGRFGQSAKDDMTLHQRDANFSSVTTASWSADKSDVRKFFSLTIGPNTHRSPARPPTRSSTFGTSDF